VAIKRFPLGDEWLALFRFAHRIEGLGTRLGRIFARLIWASRE
jgi:hypothetical protein